MAIKLINHVKNKPVEGLYRATARQRGYAGFPPDRPHHLATFFTRLYAFASYQQSMTKHVNFGFIGEKLRAKSAKRSGKLLLKLLMVLSIIKNTGLLSEFGDNISL